MMWRPLLLALAVGGALGPRDSHAQGCALSPEYASPAAFVSGYSGGWDRGELRGVSIRGISRFVVGAVHYEQGEQAVDPWSWDIETGRFASAGVTLTGKFPVDDAFGGWICPLVRADARRLQDYLSQTDRRATELNYGVAFAVPVPLTGRLGAVVQASVRRMRLTNAVTFDYNVAERRSLTSRTNVFGAGVGLSWQQAYTLVYTLDTYRSNGQNEFDLPHRIRDGGLHWRFAMGYHFRVRR